MLRLVTLLALSITAVCAFAVSAQADDDDAKTTYKVMYRVGSKAEWKEATDAGSPAKSQTAADRIAKQIKDKYRGGLAVLQIEICKSEPPATANEKMLGIWRRDEFESWEFRSDGTVVVLLTNGLVPSGNWHRTSDGVAGYVNWRHEGGDDYLFDFALGLDGTLSGPMAASTTKLSR